MKQIHILGICGTFMGGLARIAQEMGFEVTGSDANVYPPMSDVLKSLGIPIYAGYDPALLEKKPDLVIVGNAMSRGNPFVEFVLDENIPYVSGPQWLYEQVLKDRHVIAVSGTHGKTSTSSLLTHLLTEAGVAPGYLIGGRANNLEYTASLGKDPYFVIEADEYDTAFFDKRSKFLWYHPRTLIINNLEFDHADIFPDLAAIQQQFHYLIRTVPSSGLILYPNTDQNIKTVLEKGCWSKQETLKGERALWQVNNISNDHSSFNISYQNKKLASLQWSEFGLHNIDNALAAFSAGYHLGISAETLTKAFATFKGIKRRMECFGKVTGITLYDDFAHHPTAIKTTIEGLRARVGTQKIIAVLQFGSNTMKMGFHGDDVIHALQSADEIVVFNPGAIPLSTSGKPMSVFDNTENIVNQLVANAKENDHILIMSNKSFEGLHQRLLHAFENITV